MLHQEATYNLTIDPDLAGQRIDNFLFHSLKGVPKSRIYRMLRQGEVRINKQRVLPSYKIQAKDIVRIPPVWRLDNPHNKSPGKKLRELMLQSIIFEDHKILAINKPAGIASHSGSGINFGVIEILRAARPELKNLELVHRLDKDTSGCLILAKKRTVLRELHQLIRDAAILKKYLLLVRGRWCGGKRVVNAPLVKNNACAGTHLVSVAKNAVTIFRPLKIGEKMSLIEAELQTGRTHQIRLHAAYINHPIAGDKKYGDKKFNQQARQLGLDRLFLHANLVQFKWLDGSNTKIVVPLDQRLTKLNIKFK